MAELVIGDPMELATDVGSVIDPHAAEALHNYIAAAQAAGNLAFALTPPVSQKGNFVGPCLIKIEHIKDIPRDIWTSAARAHVRIRRSDRRVR